MSALHPKLRATAATLALVLVGGGCGEQAKGGTDVPAFTRQAPSADGRAVLATIGVYRTAKNLKAACALITPHFLKARFDGFEQECEYFSQQAPRRLPRSARIAGLTATSARVDIQEYSATRSVYVLTKSAGAWKIDDIAAPPKARPL